MAVGSWQGRCSYPLCGIGVDSVGSGTVKALNFCLNEHACRLKDKPEAGSVEQAYHYSAKTWSETEASEHCQDHSGNFEAENEKLKAAIAEATKTLTAYVEREREAAIKSILEKTTLGKDELEKLDLTQLRLIEKGVDNVKGTVKSVRSAGAGDSEDTRLTIGCLYHK